MTCEKTVIKREKSVENKPKFDRKERTRNFKKDLGIRAYETIMKF